MLKLIMRATALGQNHLSGSLSLSSLLPVAETPEMSLIQPLGGQATRRPLAWKVASNLLVSFKYAWAGFCYTFATQRNFRIHTLVGALAISSGAFLRITPVEMSIIGLTIALVMVLELLNTAIEAVVDLCVKQTYHELAKIAKDCAAGAVLIAAIAALCVAGLILLPPLARILVAALI